MKCWCGDEMGREATRGHPACEDEFRKREDAGKCVACGDKAATEWKSWCRECDAVDPVKYVGYPGGS